MITPKARRDKVKRWRQRNPDKVRAQKLRWNAANRDRINAARRAWGKRNRKKKYAAHKRWRDKNPEKLRAQQTKANHRRRIALLAHYSPGGVPRCACCGVAEVVWLTLDHINGDGAAHRRAIGYAGKAIGHEWFIKNNFPPIFRVLCFNCNVAVHRLGRCPHESRADHDGPSRHTKFGP